MRGCRFLCRIGTGRLPRSYGKARQTRVRAELTIIVSTSMLRFSRQGWYSRTCLVRYVLGDAGKRRLTICLRPAGHEPGAGTGYTGLSHALRQHLYCRQDLARCHRQVPTVLAIHRLLETCAPGVGGVRGQDLEHCRRVHKVRCKRATFPFHPVLQKKS